MSQSAFTPYQPDLMEFLRNPALAAQYLNACLEEEDDAGFRAAILDVVNANGGMTAMTTRAQLNRPSAYKALSPDGNPSLTTAGAMLRALGLGITVQPVDDVRIPRPTVKVNRVLFTNELADWHRNTFLERKLFPGEWRRIEAARSAIRREKLTVVSLLWEHLRVRSGGLATVGMRLGEALRENLPAGKFARGFPRFIRLSPLHRRLFPQTALGDLQPAADARIAFDGENVDLKVWRLPNEGGDWFLFEDASHRYFQADGGKPTASRLGRDPYFYSSEPSARERDGLDSLLLRDVLFAAKAVPAVLAALGFTEDLVIHAHDWVFALSALTVKWELARPGGLLRSAACVLTLHNPFDHVVRTATANHLAKLAPATPDERWAFPFEVRTGIRKSVPDTVIECAVGLFDGPIAIVSPGLASELCGTRRSPRDPLQRYHFASHLASPLRYQGTVGIQNSSFYPVKEWNLYPPQVVESVWNGDSAPILAEKARRRKELVAALPAASTTALKVIGSLRSIGDRTVLFHMFGRFDPCQKGFDVLAHAIERYLKNHRQADVRFLLTPLVNGLEPPPFYRQLATLAESKGRGRVLVLDGYLESLKPVQAGVCWSVWPSLYEPCGGATEPFAMGTPVIARAVGGLTRQLIHESSGDYCGLLYREAAPSGIDERSEWPAIENASSPFERLQSKLYNAMIDALVVKIEEAVDIRQNQPERYARLLARTTQQVQDPFFSAQRFAREYWTLYDRAIDFSPAAAKRGRR